MAHLVEHFRLVHDTAPFVPLPFHNPEVEEYPIQRPNRDFTARELAIGPHCHYPVVRCDDTQSDAAMLLVMRNARRGSCASVRLHRRAARVARRPMAFEQLSPSARESVRSVRRLAANLQACDCRGHDVWGDRVTVQFPHTPWGTGNGLPGALPAPRWCSARTIRHLGPSCSNRVRCTGTGSAPIGAFLCSSRGLRRREICSWLDAPIDQERRRCIFCG
jgi:hypothetical protein